MCIQKYEENMKRAGSVFSIILTMIIWCDYGQSAEIVLSPVEQAHLDKHFESMRKYKSQKTNRRIFKNVDFEYDKLNLDSMGISNGHYFQCNNGFMYINDYSTGLIHKIWLQNIGIRSVIGKGLGEAPGKFINVTGMAFDENHLYVADGAKGSIEIFNKKIGNHIKSIRLEHATPHRVHIFNRHMVIQNIEDGVYPFQYVEHSGSLGKKYGGPLVNKNIGLAHYHESHLLKDSENSFFYVSRILGLIGKYENEKLVQVYQTIDGIQDPDIKKHGRPGIFTAAHSGLSSNHIICLRKKYGDGLVDMVYDVYGRQNVDYQYSFRLGADMINMVVYKNLLIGCDKNNDIHIFKIKSL